MSRRWRAAGVLPLAVLPLAVLSLTMLAAGCASTSSHPAADPAQLPPLPTLASSVTSGDAAWVTLPMGAPSGPNQSGICSPGARQAAAGPCGRRPTSPPTAPWCWPSRTRGRW